MEETIPPIEDPIVATVHLDAKLRVQSEQEGQPPNFERPNLPSTGTAKTSEYDLEETLRALTQFAMSSNDNEVAASAAQIPESFNALFNSIVMLKSHTALAKHEAADAVEDAKAAHRRAKLWKHRAVVLSREHNSLTTRVEALQLQQQRAAHERTVLKRAYKQLAQDSAFDVARYVEHAIALHEDHLQQHPKSSTDDSLEATTSATSISFDDTEHDDSVDPLESSTVFISSTDHHEEESYKPLLLQVNSASLQKQLLQKRRPRPKLQLEAPVSPRAVRNLTIPSIIYQPHG